MAQNFFYDDDGQHGGHLGWSLASCVSCETWQSASVLPPHDVHDDDDDDDDVHDVHDDHDDHADVSFHPNLSFSSLWHLCTLYVH